MRHRSSSRFLLAVPVLALAPLVACSSDDEEKTGSASNGVNDVGQACQIRAAWTRATAVDCTDCLAISTVARCDCSVKDYAGLCSEQHNARNAEPACAGVAECAYKCKQGDCGCVDACLAGKEACRPRTAALDGCLAEVCDVHCR
jgi:hypothetical protein